MKSRLITAIAIGALAAGLLPGVASAAPNLSCTFEGSEDCAAETEVNVTVTEGTTIIVDGLISVGSAFPGQKVTSEPADIEWWSNQEGMTIFANMDADPFQDDGAGGGVAGNHERDGEEVVFDMDNVELDTSDSDYSNAVFGSGALPLQDVQFNGATDETSDTGTFTLTVHVPQVDEGDYVAFMTYTVADATP
jgi:hypothetical protein